MQFGGYLAPEEFWALMRETDEKMRASFLTAAVYGLSLWEGPVMIGDWAFGDGNRGFQYRDDVDGDPVMVVETADGADPRWLLAAFRSRGEFLSHQVGVAASVPDRIVEAQVDRTPVMFEVWDEPDLWWGVGVFKGRAILIESHRPPDEPITLELVKDIEPFLAGRTDWIRRARGE